MYGEEKLNASNLLRYSLTKEFTEAFSSLKYLGLELPSVLLRNYHQHIAPLVDENLTNGLLICKLQQKHGLYYISHVQNALERKPPLAQDLLKDSGRNMLAVQARFLGFAMDRFPDAEVLVILRNPQEEKLFLNGIDLPPSYRVFNYRERLKETHPFLKKVTTILTEADLLIQKHNKHLVFGRPEFRLWLRKMILNSTKVIHLMNELLLKEPIRIILSDVEVVNPDITMSLLAARYNLFFINAPVVLITDRNLIPTRASYHCAWGDYYRTWLKKRGISDSKIIKTGNLRFEYGPHLSSLNKNLASQFNFPADNYTAAYTTQTLPEEVNRSMVRWIQFAAAGQPLTVLIKRHPSDKTDYSAFTGTGQIIEMPESFKLFELLAGIDFIMTISSNTAIEAALMQKGIVVLQPEIPYQFDRNDNDYHSLLAKGKAGLVASSPEQLKNIIAKLCSSERLHRVLHNMAQRFLSKTIHKGALSTPSEDMYSFIKTLL